MDQAKEVGNVIDLEGRGKCWGHMKIARDDSMDLIEVKIWKK